MKRVKKRVMYVDNNLRLEEIRISIGHCKTRVFREVRYGEINVCEGTQEFQVIEHKDIPEWYIRHMKLEALLTTREMKLNQLGI